MRYAILAITAAVLLALVSLASAPAAMTQAMAAAAEHLFVLFKDPAFPLLLAGALIVAGLALAAAYGAFLVGPLWWRMRQRRNRIERYDGPADFAADYAAIDRDLGADPLIGHAWREFAQTLYHSESEPAAIRHTTRPQAFINIAHLQERHLALKLMPYLPNYFVGIGLLLTFVGLIAALNFATASVGGDVDEAVGGLENLLKAATFKFWTSVAGLGMSILLSLVFRLYASTMERSLIDFADAVERKMAFASGQALLHDMLATERAQRDELARFNSEAPAAMGQAIEHTLGQQLTEAVGDALKPVTAEMQALREDMASGGDGPGRSEATVSLDETLQRLTASLEGLQGWVTAIDGNLPGLCQRLERLDETLAGQGDALNDVLNQQRAVADNLRRTSEELASGIGPWQAVGQQLAASVDRFDTQVTQTNQQLQDVLTQSRELVATLEGVSQSLTEGWQAYRQRFEAVDQDLERAFEQITAAVDSHQERIRAFVAELDQHFTRATEQLSATVSDIAESADALNDALNHWVKPESLQR